MAKLQLVHIAIAILFVLSTASPLLVYHFSLPDDNDVNLGQRVAILEKQIRRLDEKTGYTKSRPTPASRVLCDKIEALPLRYENIASLQIFSNLSPRQRQQLVEVLRRARQLVATHRDLDIMRFELYLRERVHEKLTQAQRIAYDDYLRKQQLGY